METSVRSIHGLLILAISILGFPLTVTTSAASTNTYAFELIPEKNRLRYSNMQSDNRHTLYAGVEGYFQFEVDGNGVVVGEEFNLTITGPFLDSLLEPVDWAPFAPGDLLAGQLAVDFASTRGLQVSVAFIGAEDQSSTRAYVGPDVAGDSSSIFLGKDYYFVNQLERNPTYFFFQAQARPEIGGSFSIFPTADLSQQTGFPFPMPGEDDPPYSIHPPVAQPALLLPNVRLIPEPTGIALLGSAMVALVVWGAASRREHCRRRR